MCCLNRTLEHRHPTPTTPPNWIWCAVLIEHKSMFTQMCSHYIHAHHVEPANDMNLLQNSTKLFPQTHKPDRLHPQTTYSQPLYARQTALVMDPAHLISPPRAHPSGSANGGGIGIDENHQRRHHGHATGDGSGVNGSGSSSSSTSNYYVNEPWFMMLVSTMLVVVLLSTAAAAVFLRSRHTHLHHGSRSGKALGHLSGM